jgi:hypothetical protein
MGNIKHIIVVPWGGEPLLCHVIGIAGEIVLQDVLGAGIHTRNIRSDGITPGDEIIMAERTGRCHILGMLLAEPVNIGVSG